MAKRAVGFGRTRDSSSRQWIPSKLRSNFDQRVTQWMSCVSAVCGSAFRSSQESETGFSTSPETSNVHVARSVGGDRARVEDGPLLGQVLPRRQVSGVVTGFAHLLFRLGPKHRLYSNAEMRAAFRPRSFVRVSGSAAEEYLDRMVSNDVSALGPGESCQALLLTPKARVIAPLVVLRRGHEDFLLLTEPELGERVRAELVRSRFAAKAEIELEEHTSHIVFGGEAEDGAIPTADYGEPAVEVLDARSSPRSRPRSSNGSASRRGRRRGGRRSTTGCCPPRPA